MCGPEEGRPVTIVFFNQNQKDLPFPWWKVLVTLQVCSQTYGPKTLTGSQEDFLSEMKSGIVRQKDWSQESRFRVSSPIVRTRMSSISSREHLTNKGMFPLNAEHRRMRGTTRLFATWVRGTFCCRTKHYNWLKAAHRCWGYRLQFDGCFELTYS